MSIEWVTLWSRVIYNHPILIFRIGWLLFTRCDTLWCWWARWHVRDRSGSTNACSFSGNPTIWSNCVIIVGRRYVICKCVVLPTSNGHRCIEFKYAVDATLAQFFRCPSPTLSCNGPLTGWSDMTYKTCHSGPDQRRSCMNSIRDCIRLPVASMLLRSMTNCCKAYTICSQYQCKIDTTITEPCVCDLRQCLPFRRPKKSTILWDELIILGMICDSWQCNIENGGSSRSWLWITVIIRCVAFASRIYATWACSCVRACRLRRRMHAMLAHISYDISSMQETKEKKNTIAEPGRRKK